MRSIRPLLQLCALALLVVPLYAHEGHHTDKIPEGSLISEDPVDGRLWMHIVLMILSFGILMPIGMVLGLVKSRWHVPCQIAASVVAVAGYVMARLHRGRQFAKPNIHVTFGTSMLLMLAVQVAIGAGLKLHLEQKSGLLGKIFGSKSGTSGRRIIVLTHRVIGILFPVISWTQMIFGYIVLQGLCGAKDYHTGQCVAHFLMGSSFIAYAIWMLMILLVGQAWLRRTGKSQEFFDGSIITAWGIVNFLTEADWSQAHWNRTDLQHSMMGLAWGLAGGLAVWLSRGRGGKPKRNVIPAGVMILTGLAMSSHPQELMISTKLHAAFGWSLTFSGLARILEVVFVLNESRGLKEPSAFQHISPFLLMGGGFLFMSATEEVMKNMSDAHIDHVSYILIVYSAAFGLYLFVNILLHIYAVHTWPDDETNGMAALTRHNSRPVSTSGFKFANGHNKRLSSAVNGSTRTPRHLPTDSQQVRDAEEFELEGLISEDDESPSTAERRRKEQV